MRVGFPHNLMALRCSVCISKSRAAVEKALLDGGSLRDVARQFKLSKDSISRHTKTCVAESIAKRSETKELALQDRLLEEMSGLQAKTREILEKALGEGGDPRIALSAINEARHNLALVARMVGRLDPKQEQDKKDGHMVTWEEFVILYRKSQVRS